MPPEGVREAGVEDGVRAAPRVGKQDHKLESPVEGHGVAVLVWRTEVEGVKRQPAQTKHNHHRDHHFGDLLLQLLALQGHR